MLSNSHPFPAESETAAASLTYRFSPYSMPRELIEAGLEVKLAAALCNARLGYLSQNQLDTIQSRISRIRSMENGELNSLFPLDPYQGGAGTSFHMNLNEAIALDNGLDPYQVVNLHQSTNDVLPTALKLMLMRNFMKLETNLGDFQMLLQEKEEAYSEVLMTGRTQLRDAQAVSLGGLFASWAQAVARDRWRTFKARERLKEINMGGTAVGTGAGAPRSYVLKAASVLREISGLPVSRADDLMDATANYDSVVEALSSLNVLAVNLEKICSDVRLLASGPEGGMGELEIPRLIRGSSIMAGKINPVIPEAGMQICEKLRSNHQLISRLSASGELQLNAFWPMIAYSSWESQMLCINFIPSLHEYIGMITPRREKIEENLKGSGAYNLILLPVIGYTHLERLLQICQTHSCTPPELIKSWNILTEDEQHRLFGSRALTGLGYDETLYETIRTRKSARLFRYIDREYSFQHPGSPGEASPEHQDQHQHEHLQHQQELNDD